MNIVTFPEFNLTFNISRIAFSIGNIEIYWYAVCIVLGIIISLILCLKTKENFGINFEDFLEAIIFSLIFGLIGARIYYIIFRSAYYVDNPIQIFNIRDGGLAIYGGIICGAIVAYKVCKKKQISVIDFFDYICPYLALSQAIGRWGNFFNVEAYGTETSSFFRMGIFIENRYREVHPCFLYESLLCILIFSILVTIKNKRRFKGEIFGLYLILYGIIRFFIEGIRSDSLMIYNFRISQITSIGFIIFGFFLLHKYTCRKKSNYEDKKTYKKLKIIDFINKM